MPGTKFSSQNGPIPQKWLILSVTSLGAFMCTLDASIVNIALPQITAYFSANFAAAEWVVMIYLLLISSLLLTYGRLGDMFGHKPVYLAGVVVFTIAAIFNSLAPSIGFLIASRALQALGAGAMMAVAQAIIADTFDSSERGKAIGIQAMFVSLGLATGPAVGGLLTGAFGWRSIFIMDIPVGLIGVFWAWKTLPGKRGNPCKFDIAGAVTIFVSMASFLLAMSHGQEWGWASTAIITLFVIAIVFFAAFIMTESRVENPMIRLQLFGNRMFAAANLAALINFLAQYTVVFLMPFYLINFLQLGATKAGLIMSTFPAVMMILAPISGALSDRIGSRILTSTGMVVIAAGILLLSSTAGFGETLFMVAGLMLVGLGTGLFQSPNNNAIMSSVPRDQIGVASGMLATMRNVGQVMGIAVSGAIFSSQMAKYAAQLQAAGGSVVVSSQGFVWALRDTYMAAAALALLGAVISLARGNTAAAQSGAAAAIARQTG